MLKALKDGAKINPNFQPQNNKQAYFAYLCGLDIALPEPRTVEEILLCKLCTDGGKYLHTMTIRTHLGKITMVLKNNSSESLTGVYRENTNIFNGATLMLPAEDIGQDEDFYATVIGYEGGDIGILTIDKDFPFPIISSMPNAIDVISGEVIDTVTTKDGSKPEQEKKVEITKNGATEIFPDEGYVLSKVTANVNVPTASGENKLPQLVDGTLTEITAADLEGITKIREYAFYNATSLQTLPPLPSTLIKIGERAFYYCENLEGEIYIPDSVYLIGNFAFQNCHKITNVRLSQNPQLTALPDNMFYVCSLINNIVIPNNITVIGSYAFYYCTGLTNITLPNALTLINSSAFSGCENLANITLPDSLQQINSQAFRYCYSLTQLTIPAKVSAFGSNALHIGTADNKATITFLRTTPASISANTFNADYLNKIIVPAGSGEAYKTATNWANFADYIEEAAV